MLHTQVQDENVLYHGALGKRIDTEKQGPFALPLYGSSQSTVGSRPGKDGGLKTPGTHLAPRRALGDLTNATPAWPGLGPVKTPAPGRTGRRALGDITNATPGTQPATAKAEPPQAQARPLEEVYAEEGMERLAGKGWAEQEQEREARQAAERAARLDVIMSSLYPSRASLLGSSWPAGRLSEPLRSIAQQHASRPPSPICRPPSPATLPELHELNLEERMPEIPEPDWDAEFAEDQSF